MVWFAAAAGVYETLHDATRAEPDRVQVCAENAPDPPVDQAT
jgi:hypothetical protein